MNKVNIKPLSVNEAWKGRRYRTDKYKHWRNAVSMILPKQGEFKGRLRLDVNFYFSSMASDIDNPLKCVIDSLQLKYDFNDKQIYDLNVKKDIVKKGKEYFEFKITEI